MRVILLQMVYLILILLLILLIAAPQWWAQYTFRRYSKPNPSLPGTGGELARHLLDRFDLPDVQVEQTQPGGDHYDPESRTVRLSPGNYSDRSLTAVAVAAHEVGHAIQHHQNDPRLNLRTRLIKSTAALQRFGGIAMIAIPVVMVLAKTPAAGLLMLALGILSMASATVVHLVTLPVEIDASYGKALPILREGYISEADQKRVEKVLRAAAFTYVAASLSSLLNLGRWLATLRR